jgi:MFS family permease
MEAFPDTGRTPTIAEDPALGLSQRAKLEILFAVMLGLFLGALDQTIVGPALPTIVTQLHGNDVYVWAVTSYLLTSTISVPFWGKLSDLYGRKPLFIIGIVMFLIGSALSGLSQDMSQLILFRGFQGIGAGSLFPIALAVIGDLFSPAERGKYQGLFGAVFGIAFIAGPLIGGFLTDNFGWHWIFYVNVPVGLVSLYFIFRLLPTVKNPRATRNFDILGGVIFTIATSILLLGLTEKGQTNPLTHKAFDWFDQLQFTAGGTTTPLAILGVPISVASMIGAALVGVVLFILAERRAKEPIVPLGLFRNRTYAASMVSTFFAAFAFFGAIIFLPRWFQIVHGYSSTASGLAALPLMAGLISSSIASGQIVSRTGRYKWLTVGAIVIMAVAMLLMTQLRADTPVEMVWLWMFIAGLGVGPTFAVFTLIVQNAVPFNMLGVATSNLTFFRQIGGTVALAIVGTLFGSQFAEQLVPQLGAAGVPGQLVDQFSQGAASGQIDFNQLTGTGDMGQTILANVPAAARAFIEPYIGQIVDGIHRAFSLGVASTFWVGVVAAILAAIAAAAMQELALRTAQAPSAEASRQRLTSAPAAD